MRDLGLFLWFGVAVVTVSTATGAIFPAVMIVTQPALKSDKPHWAMLIWWRPRNTVDAATVRLAQCAIARAAAAIVVAFWGLAVTVLGTRLFFSADECRSLVGGGWICTPKTTTRG